MCNDAFPSDDQLTAHQVVKHGKPITEEDERREQLREAQERRDKKKDQRCKREEATRTPATFSCDQCVNFFSSQRELDDHTHKYHTFICEICQHISKTLPELDFHKLHHARHHTKEVASKAPPRRGDGMRMETQKQWWKTSKKNWTGGEKRRTWPPKKSGMTIGQHG